jgi:hypothetical protein
MTGRGASPRQRGEKPHQVSQAKSDCGCSTANVLTTRGTELPGSVDAPGATNVGSMTRGGSTGHLAAHIYYDTPDPDCSGLGQTAATEPAWVTQLSPLGLQLLWQFDVHLQLLLKPAVPFAQALNNEAKLQYGWHKPVLVFQQTLNQSAGGTILPETGYYDPITALTAYFLTGNAPAPYMTINLPNGKTSGLGSFEFSPQGIPFSNNASVSNRPHSDQTNDDNDGHFYHDGLGDVATTPIVLSPPTNSNITWVIGGALLVGLGALALVLYPTAHKELHNPILNWRQIHPHVWEAKEHGGSTYIVQQRGKDFVVSVWIVGSAHPVHVATKKTLKAAKDAAQHREHQVYP